MAKLVSILIPAYNADLWIGETLRSALKQTWPKIEVIVVDDGSRDNTRDVARRYESKHVKVISQENRGASSARNKAFEHAQGEYIQWLDADDLLAPDKIARQMEVGLREGKKTLLSSSWGYFFYRMSKAKFVRTSLWQDLEPVDWLLNKLNDNIWMACQSWLVSRELSQMVGPWDTSLTADDDGEYIARLCLSTNKIKFVPEAISYVCAANASSLSKNIYMSEKKRKSQFESVCLQIKYLRSMEDSERTKAACLNCLQGLLVYYYPEDSGTVDRANTLASELEGQLRTPELSWKWDWLRSLFGWSVAKRVSFAMQGTSFFPSKCLDYVLSKVEQLPEEHGS